MPQAKAKATCMIFAGLRKEQDLQNLIAYLKQHTD